MLVVGVPAGASAGLAPAQEVPRPVQLHAQRVEAGLLLVGELLPDVRAFQAVLLLDQLIDVVAQIGIVHEPRISRPRGGHNN